MPPPIRQPRGPRPAVGQLGGSTPALRCGSFWHNTCIFLRTSDDGHLGQPESRRRLFMNDNSNLIQPTSNVPAAPGLVHPWLVAAWPGLGGVAAMAAGHLVTALGATPLGALPERNYFGIDHVEVSNGIARSGR